MNIWIDFETYSDLDIRKVGLHKYISDKSTKVLCMAYAFNNDPVKIWVEGEAFPFTKIHAGDKLFAHNAEFEFLMLKKLKIKISVSNVVDTAAVAATYGYPRSLGKLCAALNMPEGKLDSGTRLINKLCKPQKKTKTNPTGVWTRKTAAEDFKKLYKYCIRDVEAMRGAMKRLPQQTLTPYEQKVWEHTALQNVRGVFIDVKKVKKIIKILHNFKKKKEAEFAGLVGNDIEGLTKVSQVAKFKDFLKLKGLDMESLDKASVDEALKNDIPNVCRKTLEIRKLISKSSTTKYKRMSGMAGYDNRVRGNLMYYGGHTGRFSGKGVQIQNLPRNTIDNPENLLKELEENKVKDVETACSDLIRSMIIAAEGTQLAVGDYSSVENVVLHWLAGDVSTLEDFKNGLDQYIVYSASRLNIDYDAVTKEQRGESKPDVLGLGFGGGYRALVNVAAGYGQELTRQEAQARVDFYRQKYHMIPKLWNLISRAVEKTVFTETSTTLQLKYVKLVFKFAKGYMFIRLPSGRYLTYPKVRLQSGKYEFSPSQVSYMHVKNSAWVRVSTFGGKLTENIVQAIARDLLVAGLLACEKKGYKVLASVHDEIISEVPESYKDIEKYCRTMCTLPTWARGIPLQADGYFSKYYKKG